MSKRSRSSLGPTMAQQIRAHGRLMARSARIAARSTEKVVLRDWVPPAPVCVNCGLPGPHYAPPSFGEPGRFICPANRCG